MPFSHMVDAQEHHAVIDGEGDVSILGAVDAIELVSQDPAFAPNYNLILDLRQAHYTAEFADGDILAKVLKENRVNFRRKLVVVVPTSMYLIIRLYCLLANMAGFEKIKCFTDMDEAIAWTKEP